MKKFLSVAAVLCGFSLQANAATAPIQRIDVVNLLGIVGAVPTQSPVTLKFFTAANATTPCYTATIPYDGSATFYAGTGLACSTQVTTYTVVPGTAASNQVVYNAPTANSGIITIPVPSSGPVLYFNSQIEIVPDTAAAFAATTGIATAGTCKALTQSGN